jgi:hypothetical protein
MPQLGVASDRCFLPRASGLSTLRRATQVLLFRIDYLSSTIAGFFCFAIARLRRVDSACVQIEHRAQQFLLVKTVASQIEPRLARGAACFQEHIVRLGLDD